jgi:L-threonylcarbamoyladenylate synthase
VTEPVAVGRVVYDVRGFEVGHPAAEEAVREAVEHVRADRLIAYPTETVYGFGGRCSGSAVAALAELKRREPARPFLLLISGTHSVPGLRWTPASRELAAAFWPGALTLVLADPEGRFPAGLRGAGGVAVRHTAHPIAAALVEALGEPLTSTSANAPGSPPAADAGGVVEALRELGGEGAGVRVVDGGSLRPSAPSTIVDCSGPTPHLIREGAIPLSRLRCVLPDLTGHG